MLNGGEFSPFLRNGLWAKAENISNLMENILFPTKRQLSPSQQFFGKGNKVF